MRWRRSSSRAGHVLPRLEEIQSSFGLISSDLFEDLNQLIMRTAGDLNAFLDKVCAIVARRDAGELTSEDGAKLVVKLLEAVLDEYTDSIQLLRPALTGNIAI